jgi:hypothetical protein
VRPLALMTVLAVLALVAPTGSSGRPAARGLPAAAETTSGATKASAAVARDAAAKAPTRAERRCRSLAKQRLARKRKAALVTGRRRVPAAARAQIRRKLRRCLRAARRPADDPGDDPVGGGPAPDGDPGGPGTNPPPPTLPSFVGVTASDSDGFRLTLSRPVVAAGNVTIELRNTDSGPHDLVVEPDGGGAEVGRFDPADPGAVARKVVTLPAGRWRLFCSLPNHAAAGMEATLRAE